MKKLTLLDIKQALWDIRFRKLFPDYEKEINDFLKNPGCACNNPLYNKIFEHKEKLKEYFPTKIIEQEDPQPTWKVINCSIDDLESNLKKLTKTYKQVAIARYEDQVTVIIYEV